MAAARRAPTGRFWRSGGTVLRVAVAVVLGVTLQGCGSAATPSPSAGPEGIPLETGPALAPASTSADGATVDGIQCNTSEQVAYHIHSHLLVFVNGQPRSIPYGIGTVAPVVKNTAQGAFAGASHCYYWLHVHAGDGIIHIESPTQRTYTLGQFFALWRQPLNDHAVGPATAAVTAYVNGKPFTGDPSTIPLKDHEAIQLDVGTPTPPPQNVNWANAQL
ncbi:MAG: hypothetical protein M3Y48_21385 [Actinomycetota bacterium]|nr:hypothetical protein [Actinomycetota bacterium]